MHNAYLYIEDKKYSLQQFNFNFNQPKGFNNKPSVGVRGGELDVVFEVTKDSFIREWTLSSLMQKNGRIEVRNFSNSRLTFKWEFANAFATYQEFDYSAYSNAPLLTSLKITAGIIRINESTTFEQKWNPSNPFEEQAPVTVIEEELEPQFIGYHIEDEYGNDIQQSKIKIDQTIILVIETENGDGDTITIDLDDDDLDYEYNGELLKNDVLDGVTIIGDQTRIQLKAVKQN